MQFSSPALSGLLDIFGMPYPITRLVIIGIGLIVAIVLWWLQDRTRIGAIIRAGMDDKEMTMGLGINLERVSMLVFFLAAFVAGVAGVVGAQLMGVHSILGLDILLVALIVVIVGGMGSVQGASFRGYLDWSDRYIWQISLSTICHVYDVPCDGCHPPCETEWHLGKESLRDGSERTCCCRA